MQFEKLIARLEDEREELKDCSRLQGQESALDVMTAQRIANTMFDAMEALASLTRELEEAKEQCDDADDKLARVRQWAEAYPQDIFLPVSDDDLKRANVLLAADGISMSAMHGHWARHIVSGIAGIVGADLSREASSTGTAAPE